MVRVLIVDDSSFARLSITRQLTADPEIDVVGVARNGIEALEKMKALNMLMEKYAAGKKYEPIPEYALAIVNVCEIKIEEMTGKANLPDGGESPAASRR